MKITTTILISLACLTVNGNQKQGIAFGYVSSGIGEESIMVIDQNGVISVHQEF